MNIKKMFTTLSAMVVAVTMTLPSASVFAATYSQELQDAYDWAYGKGVTTMSPIDNANMYGAITRAEMAKMLSVYAKEVLGKELNTSAACTFSDIDSVKGDLHDFIIESCQLGIMGQGITAFRPYDTISRAEFGTALSRVLWGNENEGGTPYYAKHLDALKANGIMNQIANAESTKEIRGYVMLMLMRSEANTVDCDDPVVALACLDPEADMYKECPAACREDASDTDDKEVVKSGDLSLNTTANKGSSVISRGATSELDTLTFKTSEDITVKSITLERYGLSKYNSVASIWLENEDGEKITQEKTISQSKDTVTLSLKKDYQAIEDGDSVVVVVSTPEDKAKADLGTNIGFKVINVDSSAKNVELSKDANLYDIIDYDGTDVKVSFKGSDKTYNYEEGKAYEVAKVKLTASNAAVLVNGFTLTQNEAMDLSKFVDEVTLTVDGKEVKAKASVKRDEIKLTFDDQEIAINKSSTFAVSVTLKDFDDLGSKIQLGFDSASDVNIVESKNNVRVVIYSEVDEQTEAHLFPEAGVYGYTYIFMGGKITLTNTKLASSIDAAAGSDDVVIAEGKISIGGQPVSLKTLKVVPTTTGATSQYVDSLRLLVNDEEYEADKNWEFKNIVIEEDATIKLVADIIDLKAGDENKTITISFSVADGAAAFNKTTWSNIRYDEISGDDGKADGNLVGTINISSIKVQPAKGSLTNDNTKKVEFKVNETSEETVVFKGTYTAKKNAVYLDNAMIKRTAGEPKNADDITFTVKLDGKAVATINNPGTGGTDDEDFSPVEVEAGKSISVEVVAVVFASEVTSGNLQYKLYLAGKDDADNDAGNANKDLAPMSFVENSSINVSTNSSMKQQDVILANKGQNLATFNVKPSNKASKANLESLVFELDGFTIPAGADLDDYFELSVGSDNDNNLSLNGNELTVNDIDIDITAETKVTLNYVEKLTAGQVYGDSESCTAAGGTWNAGSAAEPAVLYTDETAADYNATLSGNVAADGDCGDDVENCSGGKYTATGAIAHNAALSGAVASGAVKTPAKDAVAASCSASVSPEYTVRLKSVNGGDDLGEAYEYKRTVVNSLVKVVSMKGNKEAETTYVFDVEYSDDANNEKISNVVFTYENNIKGAMTGNPKAKEWTNVQPDTNYKVDNNSDSVNYVTNITWTDGDGLTVSLDYEDYKDFFKTNGSSEDRLRAYRDEA